MDKNKQRIAIAKACGWTSQIIEIEHNEGYPWVEKLTIWTDPLGKDEFLPYYLHDLNAMHKAEEALSNLQWTRYIAWLHLSNPVDEWWQDLSDTDKLDAMRTSAHATAAHRAEAFLKTLNLWEE
jgi:hypothetical protein